MIDWIHARCKTWGAQIRWVYLGKDGWPSRSVLGKMITEGSLGASCNRFVQHFPEVLNPEALETNNAIKQLEEKHREILFVHYVVIGKGKVKACRLEIERTVYYDRLDTAHKRLTGPLSDASYKIAKSVGQIHGVDMAYSAHHGEVACESTEA